MDKKNKTARVSSQVMELKDLISGPLVATIDADSISARRYLSYLYELAFESYDPKTGKAGPLRMLEFSYQSQDGDGTHMHKVRLPILTLVPLPLLQVKEADFDFDIQIVDAMQADQNATFSLSNPKEGETNSGKSEKTEGVKLRVTMAQQTNKEIKSSNNSSLTANMKVTVKMRQADMPGGLTKLLNLTTNNVLAEEESNMNDNEQ